MNIILMMGPPGSGKGTYSAELAKKYGYTHISVGDMLRERGKIDDALGREVKGLMDQNVLLPDEMVSRLVAERLGQEPQNATVILDGYPRSQGQAEDIDRVIAARGYNLQAVIALDVDEAVVIERMLGRARNDIDRDREKILKRLFDYNAITKPAIDHYEAQGRVLRVASEGAIADSVRRVEQALGLSVSAPAREPGFNL